MPDFRFRVHGLSVSEFRVHSYRVSEYAEIISVTLIPAKAGIRLNSAILQLVWIPAFAGMRAFWAQLTFSDRNFSADLDTLKL
jgi:hypothetical protein